MPATLPLVLALALGAGAAKPAPDPARTVAVVIPTERAPDAVRTALRRVAQAIAEDLNRGGFKGLTPNDVAVLHSKAHVMLPSCGEYLPCLARVAEVCETHWVVAVTASRSGSNLSVRLTLVDARGSAASIVSSSVFVAPPGSSGLIELPRVAASLNKALAAGAPAVAAAPAPDVARPEVPEPPESTPTTSVSTATTASTPTTATTASTPTNPITTPTTAAPQPKPAPRAAASPAVQAMLERAQKAFDAMEYDQAAALAAELIAHPELDADVRLDAYLVQATSLAIAGDGQAAEVAFRLLLRTRPDFTLPSTTAPKILGVFQRVQAEERAISERIRSVGRRQLIEGLSLQGEFPAAAEGGRPLPFQFRLRDPTSAVAAVELPFRRRGELSFSVLALKRTPEGAWRGAIPADWTASDQGFVLEYYLQSRDEQGPLLTRGTAAAPLSLPVSAGSVALPKPLPRWLLWTGVAAACVAGAASGGLGVATLSAQSDYDRYVATGEVEGPLLRSKAQAGHTLSSAALGTAIGAGVLAVVSLAILPFIKDAEQPEPR